ncbi:unnamed protein product, partial [Brachionus calyciflorus]
MSMSEEKRQIYQEQFKEWDKDGDGKITSEEFKQYLTTELEEDIPEAELKELLNDVDTNKDG